MTFRTFLTILKTTFAVFVTVYWVLFSLITPIWSYFIPILLGTENGWSTTNSFCSLSLIILLSIHIITGRKKEFLDIQIGKVVDKPKNVGGCSKCGKKKQKS